MEKTMLPKTVETVGIVYNACYGGFSLSHEAVLKYLEYKGVPVYPAKERWGYIYYLSPWEGKKGTELANLPSFYDRVATRPNLGPGRPRNGRESERQLRETRD